MALHLLSCDKVNSSSEICCNNMHCYRRSPYNPVTKQLPATVMFNATLAGHHLRADYAGSRGGSRQGSRYDLNEVGRFQVR